MKNLAVDAYVCKVVLICRELRRVLRKDGVMWWNCGDSYTGGIGWKHGENTWSTLGPKKDGLTPENAAFQAKRSKKDCIPLGLKPKDLCGIPWRTAFALQADGWVLRQAMPWVVRNKMPESCTDRPASGLEYVFMFTRNQRYFFDMEAVRRKTSTGYRSTSFLPDSAKDKANKGIATAATGASRANGSPDLVQYRNFRNNDLWFQSVDTPHGLTGVGDELVGLDVTTKGYAGSHFAVFPTALITPLILAGTSKKGCCPACGAPWQRIVEKDRQPTRPARESKMGTTTIEEHGNRDPQRHCTSTKTLRWEAGCDCNAGDPISCTVLDPFAGSGTALAVAVKHGRKAIGIELNGDYVKLIAERLKKAEGDRGFGL